MKSTLAVSALEKTVLCCRLLHTHAHVRARARARALAASRRPVARSHPVRSGIGCVMSSFGIVRIGSWVMEPFRPLTRPARS